MATLTGILYDTTGLAVLASATVAAYTASSQPLPPLTNADGSARTPAGPPVTSTVATSAGLYTLPGLAAGTPYHLYITPDDGSASYWLLYQIPDLLAATSPCVLYGACATPDGLPDAQVVYAFLERETIISGGVAITPDVVVAATSPEGTFALPLWPTASLSPQVLYRVQIGAALYRGSIPSQPNIALDAWVALSTTQRLA